MKRINLIGNILLNLIKCIECNFYLFVCMQSRQISFVCVLVIGLAGIKLRYLFCHFTHFTSPQLFKKIVLREEIWQEYTMYCLSHQMKLICDHSAWHKQWEIIPCFNRAHKAKSSLHSALMQHRVNRNLIGVAAMKDYRTQSKTKTVTCDSKRRYGHKQCIKIEL